MVFPNEVIFKIWLRILWHCSQRFPELERICGRLVSSRKRWMLCGLKVRSGEWGRVQLVLRDSQLLRSNCPGLLSCAESSPLGRSQAGALVESPRWGSWPGPTIRHKCEMLPEYSRPSHCITLGLVIPFALCCPNSYPQKSGSIIKRLSKAVTLEIIYKTDIVPRTLRVCFCSSKFYSLLLKVLYFI